MFCVVPCADSAVIEKICTECGGSYDSSCLLNMILIVDERVSGVSQMSLHGDTVRLKFAGVIPEIRGKGYGDLIMRASINKVMDNFRFVEAESLHPYFARFGFKKENGVYRARSEDIVFPSYCKH